MSNKIHSTCLGREIKQVCRSAPFKQLTRASLFEGSLKRRSFQKTTKLGDLQEVKTKGVSLENTLSASSAFWLLSQLPAYGADSATDFSKGSFSTESYIVTLGLFLISLPGLWSQIKRAPKASKKRITFEVEGPAQAGARTLDDRAKQIFLYFKKYNYEVKESGETITFAGTYAANRGQAAALVFYVFCGLASTALVFSIAVPFGGQNWYWLTALSPLAGIYYWRKGFRQEEFKVKMVTSDDEKTTDILVEGDKEEIDRLRAELGLWEKGKVYVKGILEN